MVYLQKWIWPAGLAVFYPFPKSGWPAWEILAAFALLAAITAGAWMARRKQPFILTGWLWYLGMLVPVIGLLQVGGQTCADRYTYLPQIGLTIAVTWAVADWAVKSPSRLMAVRGASIAIPCLLLALAFHQTGYWRDNITLWTHTLACTRDNSIAHNNLGLDLYQQRRLDEAAPHFREALRIDPVYAEYHLNLANVLFVQKQMDEAIAQYREAARLKPDIAIIRYNLANALLQQGNVNEAVAEYRETVRLDPGNAEALANLGHLLCQQGAVQEGLPLLKKALQLSTANPAMATALQNEIKLYESGHP
jgi:tetratricopeptide (TPR) repeat protein